MNCGNETLPCSSKVIDTAGIYTTEIQARSGWCLVLGMQRQEDYFKFKAGLIYIGSSGQLRLQSRRYYLKIKKGASARPKELIILQETVHRIN